MDRSAGLTYYRGCYRPGSGTAAARRPGQGRRSGHGGPAAGSGQPRGAAAARRGRAVDELEKDRLLDIAAGCGGTLVTYTPAP
ncbi:hypothetical protein ACF07T_37995 [Streptomyces sp. NPDC015184]|uniref:hypothetical protein n=1 Tax=Streptomyces sp. NPDC015184 TaxID=3364946 RepID=UPI003700802B